MMTSWWNNLDIKWKWRLLIAAIILLYVVAFKFNVAKTINAIDEYNSLKNVEDSTKFLTANVLKSYPGQDASHIGENDSVLNYISNYCEVYKVSIRQITQYENNRQANYIIKTNKIVFTGSYSDILHLLFDIEKEKKLTAINSIQWELTKDKTSGEYLLLATLFFKSIKYESNS